MERPLYWEQGLFLQPHHFQLLDLYYQSLLMPIKEFMESYFWGVGKVKIMEPGLGNFSFTLEKGEFLFPDGTYSVFPGNAIIEARSFEEGWIEGDKPLTVYAGIKKFKQSDKNVTEVKELTNLSDIATRFVTRSEPETVINVHQGENEAEVNRLSYLVKIFWETEKAKLGEYLLLPIAKLLRVNDEIKLSQEFIPPCFTTTYSVPLLKIIKEVRELVAFKGNQFESDKTSRGIQSAEFGSKDMVYLLGMRSLNRYVPILYHYTEMPHVHPSIVYGVLRQIIGELSSFSENVSVRGEVLADERQNLPLYDHLDLWNCYSKAQLLITRLIDEITKGPDYIITLVFDGAYYAAELKPAIFEGQNRYYLVIRVEENPDFIRNTLTMIAKLSSREFMPVLIAQALPGVTLERLETRPQELPPRAGALYFQINHYEQEWELVEKNRNIALYWEEAPEDLEIQLMVLGKS